MTKPAPFTQASLKRAIRTAKDCGLRVTGIQPDGTLLVEDALAQPTTPRHSRLPAADDPIWDRVSV